MHTSRSSVFNSIYEAAQIKDPKKAAEALAAILASGAFIDVFSGEHATTPAGKLAKEGKHEAAEFLRKQGASVSWIACGAAQGGHRDYAEELRQQHGASVNSIACGAAQGGHRDYAEELRQQHGASVSSIACGAAQSGHREYAEELRQQHDASVDWIAGGAAQGGHREYAEYLRQQHHASVHEIAYKAAQGGHREYAEYLRQQHHASVSCIAAGAAHGGYRDYAESLRQQHHASATQIAEAAAYGGDRDYAEELRQQHGALIVWIAYHAALGGYLNYAGYLHDQYGALTDLLLLDYIWCEKPHFLSNDLTLLHALTFIQSASFRKKIVSGLEKMGKPAKELLVKAEEYQHLMKTRGWSYDQAVAWKESTVPELLTCIKPSDSEEEEPLLPEEVLSSIMLFVSPLTMKESTALAKAVPKAESEAKQYCLDIEEKIKRKQEWHAFFRGKCKAPLGSASQILKSIQTTRENGQSWLNTKDAVEKILKAGSEQKWYRKEDTRQFYVGLLGNF